jgi:flavin reductase (DIM6/NTAB) family NADH-FMN oxidoreductase RutF
VTSTLPDNKTALAPSDTTTEFADIDDENFLSIMGSLPSGVSVVTTVSQEEPPVPDGLTCSAVCSVSRTPPLLLVCLRMPSRTLDAIMEHGRFAVNFLDAQAEPVSAVFAGPDESKFANVEWRPGEHTGMPVLERALAHTECLVQNRMDVGDHAIVIGRVVGGIVQDDRFPLGYWRGSYVGMFRMRPPQA